MKCPVCNKGTVKEFETAPYFACSNEFCPSYSETDTTEYDILIRTRKDLEQSEICCTEWEKQALDYKAENIALSGDLERTRKALDVAKDKLDTVRQYRRGTAVIRPDDIAAYCDRALEQITALEQKEG